MNEFLVSCGNFLDIFNYAKDFFFAYSYYLVSSVVTPVLSFLSAAGGSYYVCGESSYASS